MAKPSVKVRRVGTKEDRKRPSVFIRLKTDEQFRGYALFEPDPELSDNSGFYEYFSHWDQQGSRYVPCSGDKCSFCRANDNPGTQAVTLWYFPDNDAKDQLKIFTMNNSTIKDVTDISEEEDGILGKKFRIKRLSDKGEYRVRPLAEKALTKKEIKELLKKAPDLEDMILRQLKAELERLNALDALDDEDDEEEEKETKKTKGGKKKDEDKVEEEDEEEEGDEEDEEDEDEEDETEDEDEEEDDDENEEDEDDEEESEDEESGEDVIEFKGEKLEIVKYDEKEDVFSVKDSDGEKFELWVSEDLTVDADKAKKGVTITVDAAKDDEDDWVATKISFPRAKKDDKKKDGKKGGKKK